jgi:hypothetical protein
MKRIEIGGSVVYRERRWGWSLIFFWVVPLWLLLLEESLRRQDGKAVLATAGGALACAVTSFALLRTQTFVIDHHRGTLIHARSRFVWAARRTYQLAGVKCVLLGSRTLDHPLSPGGTVGWVETLHRITMETDQGRIPVGGDVSGKVGTRLASRLAEDLRVRVRHQPD